MMQQSHHENDKVENENENDQSEKREWILDCSDYCVKNMKTKTTNKYQPTNNQKVKSNRK